MKDTLLLSVDFEDWHQLVHRRLGLPDWDVRSEAFERQARFLLDLLDELGITATFCLLGMTVRRYPDLVEEIVARGHEPAAHGFHHRPVYTQTREEFRSDLAECVAEIETVTGKRPVTYRAPLFSINRTTPWAYEELVDAGFRYDTSLYDSPKVPDRIGDAQPGPHVHELGGGKTLWELPVALATVAGRRVPIGGGSYWRLLPEALVLRGLRSAVTTGGLPAVYLHPYEISPEPLRARLPRPASVKQRLTAAERSLWRNAARGRMQVRLRAVAGTFKLSSYEHAYRDLERRYGTRSRVLPRDGVVV